MSTTKETAETVRTRGSRRGRAAAATSVPAPGPISISGNATSRMRRSTVRPPRPPPAGLMERRCAASHRPAQPADPSPRRRALPYSHALMAAPRADSPSFPWARPRVDPAALADLDQVEVAREVAARLTPPSPGSRSGSAIPTAARWATLRRSGKTVARGSSTTAPRRRRPTRRAAGAGRAEPDQPRLHPRPRPGPLACCAGWPAQGFRPLLMEWGSPGRRRRRSTSRPTARQRLMPALARRVAWRAGRCRWWATAWAAP